MTTIYVTMTTTIRQLQYLIIVNLTCTRERKKGCTKENDKANNCKELKEAFEEVIGMRLQFVSF